MWQLEARYSGGYWLCAYQASEEALRKEDYKHGAELERATVARTIFERLVKVGRAVRVTGLQSFGGGSQSLPQKRTLKIING